MINSLEFAKSVCFYFLLGGVLSLGLLKVYFFLGVGFNIEGLKYIQYKGN